MVLKVSAGRFYRRIEPGRVIQEPRSGGIGAVRIGLGVRREIGSGGRSEGGFRPGSANISVGTPNIPVFTPGNKLPEVVPNAPATQKIPLPPAIDRRDEPPYLEELPAGVSNTGTQSTRVLPGDLGIIQPLPPKDFLNTGDNEVGWLSDIYDTVDTTLGGILPGGVDPFAGPPVLYNPPSTLPFGDGGVVVTQPPIPTVPTGPVAMGCDDDPFKGYVYKKHCGQYRWIKQRRKRRRNLASHSDIKDLNALIAVLGNGKALQSWIATHS